MENLLTESVSGTSKNLGENDKYFFRGCRFLWFPFFLKGKMEKCMNILDTYRKWISFVIMF